MCREEGTHNDLATLFLSSGHDTIVRLFSVGAVPGQPWVRHFTQVRARASPGLGKPLLLCAGAALARGPITTRPLHQFT